VRLFGCFAEKERDAPSLQNNLYKRIPFLLTGPAGGSDRLVPVITAYHKILSCQI
jgi:hypothetical protein